MIKFKVGQELKSRPICDDKYIFRAKVLSRTAKFVTVRIKGRREPVTVKVMEHNGAETIYPIYPLGRYSIAVRLFANQ
jgi:hypothetical protein